jgi:hypothetical protein
MNSNGTKPNKVIYCSLPASPQILGGSLGPGFVGGGSGSFFRGAKNTISRCLLRPLPFSFSAKGFQQPAQMSYSLPSSCRDEHSFG